jgi:hypothetical protein
VSDETCYSFNPLLVELSAHQKKTPPPTGDALNGAADVAASAAPTVRLRRLVPDEDGCRARR